LRPRFDIHIIFSAQFFSAQFFSAQFFSTQLFLTRWDETGTVLGYPVLAGDGTAVSNQGIAPANKLIADLIFNIFGS
jgi:hypothetical protein